jgi:hypothetical protein
MNKEFKECQVLPIVPAIQELPNPPKLNPLPLVGALTIPAIAGCLVAHAQSQPALLDHARSGLVDALPLAEATIPRQTFPVVPAALAQIPSTAARAIDGTVAEVARAVQVGRVEAEKQLEAIATSLPSPDFQLPTFEAPDFKLEFGLTQ